jgi:hypothetical protein
MRGKRRKQWRPRMRREGEERREGGRGGDYWCCRRKRK